MGKIETFKDIAFRVKVGKEMIELYRGKLISVKQAKQMLGLIKYGFLTTQTLIGNTVVLMVQETNQFMENKDYKPKEIQGEELYFIINSYKTIAEY